MCTQQHAPFGGLLPPFSHYPPSQFGQVHKQTMDAHSNAQLQQRIRDQYGAENMDLQLLVNAYRDKPATPHWNPNDRPWVRDVHDPQKIMISPKRRGRVAHSWK